MKILYISHSNGIGGAEQCLLTLIKGLDQKRFTPVVIVPAEGSLKDQLETMNIQTFVVPMGWWVAFVQGVVRMHFKDILEESRDVVEIIEREQIDLVHTNTSVVAQGAIAAKMTGRPHVWHLHEILKDHPRLKPIFPLFLAYKFIGCLSDAVVTVSEVLKREISGPVDPAKIKVVFNGVDPVEERSSRKSFREELGFEKDDLVICTIGPIILEKGYPTFVEAAGSVLKTRKNTKFVSVGDVWDFELLAMLRKSIQRHALEGAVRFLGYRNDIWRILKEIDIYVVSSKTESFGLSIVEAMAMGKPVIATRCGGPEEVVVEGETGFLVPVDDPDAMAKAIVCLGEDPDLRRRMGKNGRSRYERFFTAGKYCQKVEAVYEEVHRHRAPNAQEDAMAEALIELLVDRHRDRKLPLVQKEESGPLRRLLKNIREYGIIWKSMGFFVATRKAIGSIGRQVRMWGQFSKNDHGSR
jgi:glycosyltransferase involved in cell wall biosynthesis